MPVRLYVQKLIEWVAIGEPGCTFLVGGEQVALAIEREARLGSECPWR